MTSADLVLFSIFGGTALLLYGVRLVGEGLQRAAGTRLRHLLSTLTGNRFKALLVGAGVTAVLQSSSATTVMLVGFASAGLLTLRQTAGVLPLVGAIPIIFGANIGTAVTALIAAVGQNAEARRVAAAHAAFKVVGVALFFPFVGPFSDLVARTAPDVPRQIANAHSIFNIAVAAIFLPLSPWAAGFFTRLIPERASTATGAIYLNPQTLDTPAVALGQALRETLRMGDVVVQSLRESIVVLEHDDEALMRQVIARDDLIDRLEEDIKQFLVQLGSQQLTEEQSERETARIFVIANLEEIGDVIEKNLMELAEKKIRGGHAFSPQGWAEIKNVHAKVVENLELALSALTAQDPQIAEKVIRHKSRINLIERQLRQTHIQRLHEGLRESIDTSSIHLDLLSSLKRANSLAAGIAYAVLGRHRVSDDNGG